MKSQINNKKPTLNESFIKNCDGLTISWQTDRNLKTVQMKSKFHVLFGNHMHTLQSILFQPSCLHWIITKKVWGK